MTAPTMVLKIKRFLSVAVLVIVVLLVSVGLGLVPVNLFFVKTAISELVGDKLDANLDIRGPLRIRLGFRPVLSASEISLSPTGAAGQPLVQIESLAIRPRLFQVLGGNIHFRSLFASRPGISTPNARIRTDGCSESSSIRALRTGLLSGLRTVPLILSSKPDA